MQPPSPQGLCARIFPRESSSARAEDGEQRAAPFQHPLGIPSDHRTSVINSIIGFSFAEAARSRWAPSAPRMGLAGAGGDRASPRREIVISAHRGQGQGHAGDQQQPLGPTPSSLSPHTKLCQPPPPGQAPPEPSASFKLFKGICISLFNFSSVQNKSQEAKREMLDCLVSRKDALISVPGASPSPHHPEMGHEHRESANTRVIPSSNPFPGRPCSRKSSPGYSNRGSKAELSWERRTWRSRVPQHPSAPPLSPQPLSRSFPSSLLQRNALVATLL